MATSYQARQPNSDLQSSNDEMRMRILHAFLSFILPSVLSTPRVGILVHGFDLGADNWAEVVWGDPRAKRMGRVSHGLKLARIYSARCVCIGSGGTCDEEGVTEAQRTKTYALSRVSDLSPRSAARHARKTLSSCVLLNEPRNTLEEVLAARREDCWSVPPKASHMYNN